MCEKSIKPLVILTGPTAVGKTALSLNLARAIHGEIISADSMQVYKYMDIGTAKIMPEEMGDVKHYLIDCYMPDEAYNVVKFQHDAKMAMEEIWAKGKVPILTGGTGFYIQAVLYDIDFCENDENTAFREELEELAKTKGPEYLHEELKKVDPEAAEQIHFNNVKKTIRALEYYKQTGSKISQHNETERQKQSPYNSAYFVLNNDRQFLYDQIEKRIDLMVEAGLVDEVRKLMDMGYDKSMVSMQGLGYKEIIDYLEGTTTFEEAIAILKRDTRHFAKRQLTWFRREKDVIWMDKRLYKDESAILDEMVSVLRDKAIIESEKES